MKFIYLINVIDKLHSLLIIALFVFGIFILVYALTGIFTQMDSYGSLTDNQIVNHCKRKMWRFICYFLLTFFIFSFIPSKKTLYEIFGIGTVIDYVQSNDNAKKIPDKCIEAINLWLDDNTKESNPKE